ncbi:unnamed protein product [Amoebophrya sp. A25]|nr:unnamed protein product [Amoebophrya sp. A25]|eukprot:GSA25T00009755001.1
MPSVFGSVLDPTASLREDAMLISDDPSSEKQLASEGLALGGGGAGGDAESVAIAFSSVSNKEQIKNTSSTAGGEKVGLDKAHHGPDTATTTSGAKEVVAVQRDAAIMVTATPVEPEIERDTEETEEMTADEVWRTVLMPQKLAGSPVMAFAAGYDQRLFDGWVKQPSPCCGAASVAGAWNALRVVHRADSQAKNFRDLTDVLAKYCDALARGRRKRLDRMLDGYLRCVLPGEEIRKMGEFFDVRLRDPMFFNNPEAVQAEYMRRNLYPRPVSPSVGPALHLRSGDSVASSASVLAQADAGLTSSQGQVAVPGEDPSSRESSTDLAASALETSLDHVDAVAPGATCTTSNMADEADGIDETSNKRILEQGQQAITSPDNPVPVEAPGAPSRTKIVPGKDMCEREKKSLPVSKYRKTEEKFPMILFLEKYLEEYLFEVEQRTWTGTKKKKLQHQQKAGDEKPPEGVTKTAAQNALKAVCEARAVAQGFRPRDDAEVSWPRDASESSSVSTEAVTAGSSSCSSATGSRSGSKESVLSEVFFTPYSDLSSASETDCVAGEGGTMSSSAVRGRGNSRAGLDEDANIIFTGTKNDIMNQTISSAIAGAAEKEALAAAIDSQKPTDFEALLWTSLLEMSTEERFLTELGEMYIKKRAVARLTQYLPGTAEIGNWGILKACRRVGLAASTLVNRRSIMAEKNASDADRKASLWNLLKSHIGQPNCVLLFHLTNHYALIYCWREFFHEVDEIPTASVAAAPENTEQALEGSSAASTATAAVEEDKNDKNPNGVSLTEVEMDVVGKDSSSTSSSSETAEARPKASPKRLSIATPRGGTKRKKKISSPSKKNSGGKSGMSSCQSANFVLVPSGGIRPAAAKQAPPLPVIGGTSLIGRDEGDDDEPMDVVETQTAAPERASGTRIMKHVREIYTARKGQRPTAWLSLDEVYKILVGWSGYAIIKVSLKRPQDGGSDQSNDEEDEADICQ